MTVDPTASWRRALLRAWLFEFLVLGAVQAVVALLVPGTAPYLAVVALAAGAGLLANRNASRAIGDPAGDLLLETGVAVRSSALLLQESVGRGLALAWLVVVAGDLLALVFQPHPVASLALVAGSLVEWLLVRARRFQRQLLELHGDVVGGHDTRARLRLAAFPADVTPDVREALEVSRIHLSLREGDGAAGVEALERRWSGGLDTTCAWLAMVRVLRSGDAELARRWLAAPRPSPNPYERYLEASLTALEALTEGRAADAREALVGVPPLPAFYGAQLALLGLAARRAAGEDVPAPEASEGWRRTAQPWMWAQLTGQVSVPVARPVAPRDAPAHPFAPPAEDLPVPAARRRGVVGMVPVPRMAVWRRANGTMDRVRGVAVVVLLALAPLLLVLSVLIRVLGSVQDDVLVRWTTWVGLLGLAVGGVSAVPQWFVPRGARPAFVLDDGRQLPVSWWWVFGGQGVLPVAAMVVVVSGVFGAGGTLPWMFALVAALLPLVAWGAWRRLRGWRLLRDAHHPDPARLLAWPRPELGAGAAQLGALRALAHLRSGAPDLAEAEARGAAPHGPDAGFVLGWLAAGRGELELERALAAPDPEGHAARYQVAVRLALGALATGKAERVAGRVTEWEDLATQLPNVYGDLLARLVEGVRRALGSAPRPVPPGTAWVDAVWPFVP